jgi:hypothetical protein
MTMIRQVGLEMLGAVAFLAVGTSGILDSTYAQVFPPRSSTPSVPVPSPPSQPAPQEAPGSNPAPQQIPQGIVPEGQSPQASSPTPLLRTIPFATLLGGDLSKSFVQLTNLRSQVDSNFVIGQSLGGRFTVPPYVHEASNGSRVFVHVNAMSNPPMIKPERNELHLEFHFPTLQLKTYYKDYSPEGDQAVADTAGEDVIIDVYLVPATNHLGFPTYHSARAVFRGHLKSQDKCVYWFDLIFPINICDVSKKYLESLGSSIENGMREALHHSQTRNQFDQVVWQSLRADLLMQAGVNPMSPAQIMVFESAFHGTDYVVKYLPR